MPRSLLIIVVAVALVAGVGGVLYAFGTPQAPAPANVAGAGVAGAPVAEAGPAEVPTAMAPQAPDQGGSMADVPLPPPGTEPPAADPNSPLAIQIPGCVCHSDDPKIVEEHAKYRMNQCAGCHAGGTPTGQ